jgi:hypothetical protein
MAKQRHEESAEIWHFPRYVFQLKQFSPSLPSSSLPPSLLPPGPTCLFDVRREAFCPPSGTFPACEGGEGRKEGRKRKGGRKGERLG